MWNIPFGNSKQNGGAFAKMHEFIRYSKQVPIGTAKLPEMTLKGGRSVKLQTYCSRCWVDNYDKFVSRTRLRQATSKCLLSPVCQAILIRGRTISSWVYRWPNVFISTLQQWNWRVHTAYAVHVCDSTSIRYSAQIWSVWLADLRWLSFTLSWMRFL